MPCEEYRDLSDASPSVPLPAQYINHRHMQEYTVTMGTNWVQSEWLGAGAGARGWG